jgi:hypothetical protein
MKVRVKKAPKRYPAYAAGGYIQDVTPVSRKEGKMMITEEIPNNLGYGVPPVPAPMPAPAPVRKRIRYEKLKSASGATVFSPVFEGNWTQGEIRNSWSQIPESFGGNTVLRGDAWKDVQVPGSYKPEVVKRAPVQPVYTGSTVGNRSYSDIFKRDRSAGASYAAGGRVRKPRSDRFGSLMGYAGGGEVPCPDCPHQYAFGDKVGTMGYDWDPYTDPRVLDAGIFPNNYGPTLWNENMSQEDVSDTFGNSPFAQGVSAWTNPTAESYNERAAREYDTIYGPVDKALAASRQSATSGYTPEPPAVRPQTINTLSYQPPASPGTPWSAGTPYQFTPQQPDFNVNPTSVSESLYRDLAEQNTKDFEARQIAQRNTWGTDPFYKQVEDMPLSSAETFRFDLNPKPKGQQEMLTSSSQKMPANYGASSGNRDTVSANLRTTMGDVVGGLGTALGTLGPLWSTIKNRRGDKPHSNYYQQFGKEALESNRLAQEASAKAGSAARINARILSNTSKAANRGSTSSLNVLRGLDAITNLTNDMSNANIDSTEAQRMIGLLQQRSDLQNERDKMVMTGEEARDLGDRRDRDAYYSQLSKNLADAGTSIQSYGKQMNRQVMNQQELDLLNMMSRYGFNVRVNNGRLVATNAKGETTDLGS